MNTNSQNIKRTNGVILQSFFLIAFTLFSLYFSVSMYRMYHMKIYDLNELTGKVEKISLNKPKGKHGKPEVWIDIQNSGKFRVAYGNNKMLNSITDEVKGGDLITIYLKKAQHIFIDISNDNDVLQIAKNGRVIYSLDIPQKNFHDYYLFSAVMSFLLPLGFVFYWFKSRKNSLLEEMEAVRV